MEPLYFIRKLGAAVRGLQHKDCKRFLKMQVFWKIYLKKCPHFKVKGQWTKSIALFQEGEVYFLY